MRIRALASATFVIATAVLAFAGSAGSADPVSQLAVPGELIVGFEATVSDAQASAAVSSVGAKDKKRFRPLKARLVSVEPGKAEAAMKKLVNDPRVAYVEPNYVVKALALPSDPSFGQLWGLRNTGQVVQGVAGTPDADIDADEAWDVTTGSTSTEVAVIDTGVDFGHVDLGNSETGSPLLWINPGENCSGCRTDGVDNDGNGYVDDYRGWDFVNGDNNPFDDNGHGTHVAGTIGALGSNGVGVTGVNWQTSVMPLKFLDWFGSGTTADAISAILYAAAKGADVMSNSWGGGGYSQALANAIATADLAGSLFVAAAGNNGANNDAAPFYPAGYEAANVVSVAATNSKDQLASFSNYGAKTVDLGAPGVSIYSTIPGNQYDWFDGTSMATPHVSGVAALVKAADPAATGAGLRALLFGTVDPIAALAGKSVTGGRLNAAKAVKCSQTPQLLLEAPRPGFRVSVGEPFAVRAIGTNCAHPSGATVTAEVNGAPMSLTPRGDGLYTGVYAPTQTGALTVEISAAVGPLSKSATVSGSAVENYVPSDGPYEWVDATAGGTKLTLGDDEAASVTIPFSFTFYGTSFSSVKVSSNAMLVFGANPATAYDNRPLPDPMTPNRILAPLWDDLSPPNGGGIWYRTVGTAPNRRFVVAWVGVPHYLAVSHKVTLEAILEEGTNGIVFQYQDVSSGDPTLDYGADASVGMEDAAGAIGRQFLYKDPLLASYEGSKSLRFTWSGGSPDLTPPGAPGSLTAMPGNKVVVLDWADNSEPDLAGYRVYRRNGGSWTLVGSPVASSFTDTGLVNGTAYTYRVTAVDAASPPNEGAPSSEVTATPADTPTAVYQPAGYTILSGSVYSGRGALSRLFTDDGSRLEIKAKSGVTKVSSFYAFATIAAGQLATLKRLQIDYNGNATGNDTNVSLRVWNWSTAAWVTIDGPVQGATADRSATWSSSSPAAYVSPSGEVRVNVHGTRPTSLRVRTDLIRFTIDY